LIKSFRIYSFQTLFQIQVLYFNVLKKLQTICIPVCKVIFYGWVVKAHYSREMILFLKMFLNLVNFYSNYTNSYSLANYPNHVFICWFANKYIYSECLYCMDIKYYIVYIFLLFWYIISHLQHLHSSCNKHLEFSKRIILKF
jgi:hypothetical protein